jgi:hypothetical protein
VKTSGQLNTMEETMELLNVKRITKYGVELVEPKQDGQPNYRNTSVAVKKFLNFKQSPQVLKETLKEILKVQTKDNLLRI